MKSSPSIWRSLVCVKSMVNILSTFVAFLGNMNFNKNPANHIWFKYLYTLAPGDVFENLIVFKLQLSKNNLNLVLWEIYFNKAAKIAWEVGVRIRIIKNVENNIIVVFIKIALHQMFSFQNKFRIFMNFHEFFQPIIDVENKSIVVFVTSFEDWRCAGRRI